MGSTTIPTRAECAVLSDSAGQAFTSHPSSPLEAPPPDASESFLPAQSVQEEDSKDISIRGSPRSQGNASSTELDEVSLRPFERAYAVPPKAAYAEADRLQSLPSSHEATDEEHDIAFQDSSFLIEEAYNQEPGIVQHIFNFVHGWDADRGHSRIFDFLFTQEWPIGSQRHQFSYQIPASSFSEHPDGEPSFEGEGLGDIQLNYRFQALCGEGERLSAPDYRSACHPMPRISHFSSTCRLSIGTKRSRVGALCGSNSDNCSASNFSSSTLLLVSLIEGGPVARIDTRYVQP